ncbi:hypothetical protein [Streptomyces sp. NBC_00893]|uniref:hypothetical protein n=1 Tax=Streptomyces sp. NBC_00893 TaxID=2975862 RepID=UPI00224D72A4|nr:hypothetical protein [Streptomyces sp. NBC_00893]MCX4851962.1 hypothetical protein [Streptomyces sp. NBC_00893]
MVRVVCYGTSLEEQFELVQQHWSNDERLPVALFALVAEDELAGFDQLGPGVVVAEHGRA